MDEATQASYNQSNSIMISLIVLILHWFSFLYTFLFITFYVLFCMWDEYNLFCDILQIHIVDIILNLRKNMHF